MKKVLVVAVTAGLLIVTATGATATVIPKMPGAAVGSGGSSYGYGNGSLAVTAIVDRVVPGAPVLPTVVPVPDAQAPTDLFAPPADPALVALGVPPSNDMGATAGGTAGVGDSLTSVGADAIAGAGASFTEVRGGNAGFVVPEPGGLTLMAIALLGLTWAVAKRIRLAPRRM